MRLNNRWAPAGLQELAAWFENFSTNMQTLGASLGFSTAELAAIDADAVMLTQLAANDIASRTYVDGVRAYRKIITEGDIGDPAPVFPTDFTNPPTTAVAPGLFERLDRNVTRVRAAANYTNEIGEVLDIIPSRSDDIAVVDLKPVLKASTQPGNVVEVSFVRGKTDGVEIETMVDGTGGWVSSGRYLKSPAVLNVPNGTGAPRAVQIRARFVDGNLAVGQNSDTVNVVTTP